MDRINDYKNMNFCGFTPIKQRAGKLNLQKKAAMRTACLDSTLDFEGIQSTVNHLRGKQRRHGPTINDRLKRKPSRETPSYLWHA